MRKKNSGSVRSSLGRREMYYTYIVECADGSYYTGYAVNVEKRVKVHNEGKGAKYTKARRPVKLVYVEEFERKEQAMRREWQIKQMPRAEKEKLKNQRLQKNK